MASPDSFESALSAHQSQTCSADFVGMITLGRGGHGRLPASTRGPGTNFITGASLIGNAYGINRNKELVPGTSRRYHLRPHWFVWSAVPQIFRVFVAPEDPVSSLHVVNFAANTFDLLQQDHWSWAVHSKSFPLHKKSSGYKAFFRWDQQKNSPRGDLMQKSEMTLVTLLPLILCMVITIRLLLPLVAAKL